MLLNKTAVITGSNKGIGKATLEIFAKNGANIWACIRSDDTFFEKEIIELEKKNNIFIKKINFDFSNEESVKKAANTICSESETIDILVNNAGIIDTSLFQMTKIDNIRNLFEINFFSQLLFSQIIIKKMIKKKGGNIINIISTSAIDANIGRLGYASSKSAMLVASQILSKELANFNIRVNSIAPGLTNTDLMRNNHSEEIIKENINKISLKRIAEPNEIAKVALFLASDLSNYVTGQVLRVDGGML